MISSRNKTIMFLNYKLNPQFKRDKFKPDKSMDQFLDDGGLLHERINNSTLEVYLGPYEPCKMEFFCGIRIWQLLA